MHRDFYRDAILLGNQTDHIRMQCGFELGQMLHERAYASFVGKQVVAPVAALVGQLDADPGVEKSQFTQALGQNVVVKFNVVREGGRAGQETHQSAALA